METLVGKKFYLSEPYVDFPYPEDIRILEDHKEKVIIKQGARKIVIDKNTLHKYYTMLTPKFTFSIRFFLNVDLRNAIILMVNSYKPDIRRNVFFIQYANLFKLYFQYSLDKKFNNHYYCAMPWVGKVDNEHVLKVDKNIIKSNDDELRDKRFVVYGYQEDELRDLVKFIPRKKWLNTIKYAFNCIDSIYDYKIETTTKGLLRFFKELQKDYSNSIETCNVCDILSDTYLHTKGYQILQVLINLKLGGNKPVYNFTDKELDVLGSIVNFDHGLSGKILSCDKVDLSTIKIRKYKETDNIEDMKNNNPNTIYKLIKFTEQKELYIVSYKEKLIVQQILSGENKALSDQELSKFLSKKTVN